MTIEVLKPGLLSTFQDLGRIGHQAIGMPTCGAMDALSHRIANALVGNHENEATLEITLVGPTLRFGRAATIVLAGADLGASVHPTDACAVPLAPLRPVTVTPGTVLQFGRRKAGVRSYLALQGGFGLPPLMDSASTYLRGALGGWQGRALQKGDLLPLPPEPPAEATPVIAGTATALLLGLLERPRGAAVRLIEGPEWAQFNRASQRALMSGVYRIGSQSDRMGYRLEGPSLQRDEPRDMLSEAVAFGTMQVPPDGRPIVLMADRQTSGGYPRMAQVASVDLPLLAQHMPGDTLRFEPISLDAAQHLLVRRARAMQRLAHALRPHLPQPETT
ncbi:biotin-dependent carboxyltransferase family protein [Xylophilus sp. GOD-11R]|uniref:5-oxoprolinase subunit C family protein n=1 Tax=Xylophilus sp. GOD-11R TaxID=3089814 RepID=UPI00298CB413|nr:biotin-dependent carboxyltransferase family protein [Xylophilus sp. GOD-11R]WPB56275.1 biotin-dependent carboxyltransferase family protein [Xylophilus sp. GOD-11R]